MNLLGLQRKNRSILNDDISLGHTKHSIHAAGVGLCVRAAIHGGCTTRAQAAWWCLCCRALFVVAWQISHSLVVFLVPYAVIKSQNGFNTSYQVLYSLIQQALLFKKWSRSMSMRMAPSSTFCFVLFINNPTNKAGQGKQDDIKNDKTKQTYT